MLIRIVRMTFAPAAVGDFLAHFETVAPKIRRVDGCEHLELWRDERYPNVCTTYSHWTSEDALNAYRHSDLFAQAWQQTKPLFAAPPTAHSYTVARPAEAIEESTIED
jgi:quinol monooxygenase YgiN